MSADSADSADSDAAAPDDPDTGGNNGEMPALEGLLREERAAVAVTVALASGATTYAGRTQLERLGGELVLLCAALRERLDLTGRPVPSGASPEAGMMLATESYDARLAALADFFDTIAARATEALAESDNGEYLRTLRDLISAHAQAAAWLRERAAAFAASRPPDQESDADPGTPDASGMTGTDAAGTDTDANTSEARDGEPRPEG